MRTRSPTRKKDSGNEDTEIYVGNINAQTPVEPEDLKRLFGIAGNVTNVRIEKSASKDTHFAFITFSTVDEAEQGCLFDGFKYHALSLKVQRKGRPGPPKVATHPNEEFARKLRELQEQENTDLYLTNLNTADASEEVLHETFSAFGDVRRVHLHGDPSNPSRPAFITFSRPEQVQRAVDQMDGKEFLGNTLGVCKARVGQRFWAIDATNKKNEDKKEKADAAAKDAKGTKTTTADKRGTATTTTNTSKADDAARAKDAKAATDSSSDKDARRRRKEKEDEKPPAAATVKKTDEKKPTANTATAAKPAAVATASPATSAKPAAATASATGAAAAKPAAAAVKPATAAATAKPAATAAAVVAGATTASPSTLKQDAKPAATDPASVLNSVITGLETTRIADKERNINPYCSTDERGVPTMILPTAGERVCHALHTVAASIRREVDRLKVEHSDANATLKREVESLKQLLATEREKAASSKTVLATAEAELTRLRSQREQLASLRLLNLKQDTAGKDVAQLCSRFGPVQHVAMLGTSAHVTFCQTVDMPDIVVQLSTTGQQAEVCYHSATIVGEIAKLSTSPSQLMPSSAAPGTPMAAGGIGGTPPAPPSAAPGAPLGNGVPGDMAAGQSPIVGAPSFPSLPLVGSGLNPNASAYKSAPGAPPGSGGAIGGLELTPGSGRPGQQQLPIASQQSLPRHGQPGFAAQQSAQPARRGPPQDLICVVCGSFGLQVCSVCMKTYYCGSECQASHWPSHMNECETIKAKGRR